MMQGCHDSLGPPQKSAAHAYSVMNSTAHAALPVPQLLCVAASDAAQWQQQREHLLAFIKAEDLRRSQASQELQVTDPEHTASVASTAAQTGDSEIQTRREHASSYEALGRTEKCASSSSESSAEPTNDSEGDADYTMSAGNSVNYSGSSYVDSENDWMTEMTDVNTGESDVIESEDILGDVSESDGSDHEGIGSETSDSEEPELLEYNQELLTEAEQNQLKADLKTLVKYHEKEQAFGAHLNLDLLGGQGLARVVEYGGSWAVCSPEQSDKTVGIAAIGLVSARKHKPCVAMVCDLKSNAKKVQEGLQTLLRPFDIEVRYMSGKRCWQDASASIIFLNAFRQGRVMLLMSAHAADIWHLNSFLTSHRFSGLTVSIDESDNVWSSYIPGASEKLKLTVRSQRETGMYRLLGSLLPGSYKPLRKGSRVRSLVQVSATHVNTIHWHQMWQLPFKSIEADKDLLDERGYALEKDMLHARSLDPDMLNLRNDYAIDSQEVVDEFKTFREDQRPGRLMLLCLTPYVRKDMAMTSFAMAKRVVEEHCPDAVCLVVHGRGVNALYRDARKPEYREGQGREMRTLQDCQGSSRDARRLHFSRLIKQAQEAISCIDRELGLNRAIVVIGYSCIGRCTSIRSKRRVINYIVAGYQKGKTCGDLKQMLMRGAGSTRAVRQAQGYQHIRTVCTDEDWDVVQNLYDFTQDAMKLAATGRVEDLAAWTSADYNIRYLNLVQTRRPMVRRTMGNVDLTKVHMGGQPLPPAPAPARKRRSEGCATQEANSENARAVKRHRQVTIKDPHAAWYRLMHCIWNVCMQQRSATIFRDDLIRYCGMPNVRARTDLISPEEIDEKHRAMFTTIGRGHHFIRLDKPGGIIELRQPGQLFCEDNFNGILVTGEE